MRSILFLFLLISSCKAGRENESRKTADANSVIFVVLNIQKDPSTAKNIIKLISKTASKGQIKNQNTGNFEFENYLSVYLYGRKTLVDTLVIEHPLYKHLEYIGAGNTFSVKDTVLDNADFFLRLQGPEPLTEIRISETLKHKAGRELTVIKL